ncbi:ADP-ribosylation factor GTPase-activating protein AGD2-like isoform X1 [Syzygium oleosum]|uniref:ADP-ribosylation factor GTPase-activating protein AGD2-like isoform X1 n=2 Tax=Syzygium oleosum TaxID=219896 RepID=UPI0011D1D1F3|nr:ADP-ribosylation factor GTPase-activating protein AGD2-like isoform X1 [Syzygium oleosum]XP_056169100.1 ADP-ribosylation factor GTPase-activating protein AGD2-like isoform X1 [Syzygium oleosum]
MAAFMKLDDSPMFHKQIFSLEQMAEELKERCQTLYRGSAKFMASLGEACNADTTFVDSLEAFGGGQDDPVSVSIGGPVISKFISAFHELASYKELLRSQVEHVLVDRLTQFVNVDMQEAKESRRRFDKTGHSYDQAREKFVSLKRSTRGDIVAELEEDLQNSKSAFERSRFNLVSALMNIETKKKYEFLESISAIMDAHLRYFKQGYELLSQLEPFIHQVLTYAQQSKEMANVEQDRLAKRIQEFRTQAELDSLRASSGIEPPDVGTNAAGANSYRDIETITTSTRGGEVQTVKQGYLLKRSSSLRGDWKRRFFVLDNLGTLYYYRNKSSKSGGTQSHHSSLSAEQNSSVFSIFLSKHNRGSSFGEETLGYRILDLHTSTIKIDAENTDLRLCFRIISPSKSYTLQAENEADRMDWVNKIKGAIASLFNSHFLQQPNLSAETTKNNASRGFRSADANNSSGDMIKLDGHDSVAKILRSIPGNDLCAECGSPEPDWASLNLGILLCIKCSGVHRNLGVHISKVRSLTLDVKVWETTVLDLFHALGNSYCNSIWEGLLQDETVKEAPDGAVPSMSKPCPNDAVSYKEKYIHAKYVEKLLIVRDSESSGSLHAKSIWQAVKTNNLRDVYRLVVTSDMNIINSIFDEVDGAEAFDLDSVDINRNDPANCLQMKDPREPANCLQGCSLLHLACHQGNPVMLELLLQFGAGINMQDFHGRTPLHHCISMGNNSLAKFLLKRGARPSIKDGEGLSALERAMEMGAITDEDLFILLAECE